MSHDRWIDSKPSLRLTHVYEFARVMGFDAKPLWRKASCALRAMMGLVGG